MTQGPFDPLALWRDMLTKWQATVNATAGRNIATAEFSRFMNQTVGQTFGMSVQLQHTLGMVMGKYLAALNMPTRADLASMDGRLRAIEDQLARLSKQVASASAEPSPAAQPADARLKGIEDQLARLTQAVASASAGPQPSPAAKPIDAKPAHSKRAPPHRPEPASPSVEVQIPAQPARAAKPARRTAKKPSLAS